MNSIIHVEPNIVTPSILDNHQMYEIIEDDEYCSDVDSN